MLQAILLGIIAFIGNCDYALGTSLIKNPIVLGPVVGLVMGDVTQGIIIGGILELAFIGAQSVGAFVPPNVVVGGVLGTAFAISTGKGAEVAVTLAYPIALLASIFENLFMSAIFPLTGTWADKYAEKGNARAIEMIHIGDGIVQSLTFGFYSFCNYRWINSSNWFITWYGVCNACANDVKQKSGTILLPGILIICIYWCSSFRNRIVRCNRRILKS